MDILHKFINNYAHIVDVDTRLLLHTEMVLNQWPLLLIIDNPKYNDIFHILG